MCHLLCGLINATLTGKELKVDGVGESEWEQCFETARQQQVLAMTFPTMSELLRKLGAWLAEEGPAGQWHSLRCLETNTVLLESKDGVWEPLAPEDILAL